MYKVCYSIGFRRHETLCATYTKALWVMWVMWGKSLFWENHYNQPRIYQLTDNGWEKI